MATVARELIESNTVPVDQDALTPVIIDRGEDVRIALVRFPVAPEVGDRFTFEGTTCEVVRTKDHARGCVARPLNEPAS